MFSFFPFLFNILTNRREVAIDNITVPELAFRVSQHRLFVDGRHLRQFASRVHPRCGRWLRAVRWLGDLHQLECWIAQGGMELGTQHGM